MEEEFDKVLQTIHQLFISTDERNWTQIEEVLAKEVLIDYTSMNGGIALTLPSHEVVNNWALLLPGFDKTIHTLNNPTIEIENDIAKVKVEGKAMHYIADEVWIVEGTYDIRLICEHNRWIIFIIKFNYLKQSGNIQLPRIAYELVGQQYSTPYVQNIIFYSEGFKVVGTFYRPKDYNHNKKYPAIIIDGAWTTVKEQMAGLYAKELAKQGFITLSFDHRCFGESEGEPRNFENPEFKIKDLHNAVSFMLHMPEIDESNIFLVGICAGAGYIAGAATLDSRIRGIGMIVPRLHDPESIIRIYGRDGIHAKLEAAQHAKELFDLHNKVEYVPAVSTTNPNAAMFGKLDYYLNPTRGGIPEWNAHEFAVMSWEEWLNFNPMLFASRIQCYLIMIHSNDAVLSENAKEFFHTAHSLKKVLHWTQGEQTDFYDQPTQVNEAVRNITLFFQELIK